MKTLDLNDRTAVCFWIVKQEMRTDSAGNPIVYDLPANDGGGEFEVAGINEKYNPLEAVELRNLVRAKRYNDVKRRATEIIRADTDAVLKWEVELPAALEAFARDCVFNRGAAGALKIFQIALLVTSDGLIGPNTRTALGEIKDADVVQFLRTLRVARELYEYRTPAGYRANLWKGLTNRWNNSLAFALRYT